MGGLIKWGLSVFMIRTASLTIKNGWPYKMGATVFMIRTSSLTINQLEKVKKWHNDGPMG